MSRGSSSIVHELVRDITFSIAATWLRGLEEKRALRERILGGRAEVLG
jgi:hypothetical protein